MLLKLLILSALSMISTCQEVIAHEIPKFKRGSIELVDETALTNPNSFDYDFSDDLNQPVDKEDLYDQFIDQLPMFHIYKLGIDRGVTEVPIVTRPGDTWFTPSTLSNREQKFTFYLTTPMTPKKKTTTTEAPTTKVTVPSTTTTEKTTTPTTTTTTTTPAPTSTTTKRHRRPFVPRQPVPVFKVQTSTTITTTPAPASTPAPETPVINRGPIWRKGGVIIDSTTTPRPLTTTRQWTVRGFRVRVIGTTTTTTEAPRTTARARATTRQTPGTTTRTWTTTTTTTTEAPSTTTRIPWWRATTANRWVAGPRHPPRFNQNQNWKQPIRKLQETVGRTVAPPRVDPISQHQPKPVVIHTGRYSGPTYNCRVLNPFTDGHPSSEHDSSCKMLYPGLSLDGTCRCFYKVAGRDEHGCATGFIYACRDIGLRSISV
ncbi:unnamed protein product [Caenorhabditis sp. 36 PRJEB53466]|nr:unnamed protein product [Caenorhabditis sp. 36 PRJEB53466]